MQTLWSFATRNFVVELACDDEQNPNLSWADQDTLDKLASGEWVNVTFRVRVLGPNGETLSEDYLGNSVYADPAEFRDHIGAQGKYGSYFTDMVHEAIRQARSAAKGWSRVHLRETVS